MTTDTDGQFDALFGNVNFIDDDNDPATPVQRLGGIARYDLSNGSWDLVGTNPALFSFGFGASPAAVPEPGVYWGFSASDSWGVEEAVIPELSHPRIGPVKYLWQ